MACMRARLDHRYVEVRFNKGCNLFFGQSYGALGHVTKTLQSLSVSLMGEEGPMLMMLRLVLLVMSP